MLGEGRAVELLAKILHHVVALELTMDEQIDANLLLPTYRSLCLPLQEAVVVGVAQGAFYVRGARLADLVGLRKGADGRGWESG